MRVDGQLEGAQLEVIETADEAAAGKQVGRVYYNKDEDQIKVADSGNNLKVIGDSLLGDVKTSILTLAQFNSITGGGWALADGSSAIGTDLFALTGDPNLPDLRGVFLRGQNNGRSDGFEDPLAGKILGQSYMDKTGDSGIGLTLSSHNITHKAFRNAPSTSGIGVGTLGVVESIGSHDHTISGFDDETSPKHAVVNYFIKVNK